MRVLCHAEDHAGLWTAGLQHASGVAPVQKVPRALLSLLGRLHLHGRDSGITLSRSREQTAGQAASSQRTSDQAAKMGIMRWSCCCMAASASVGL